MFDLLTIRLITAYTIRLKDAGASWQLIGTGALLDSVEAVLAYARTMTWKGLNPTVELVTNIYHSGVKLTQEAMHKIEKQIERLSGFQLPYFALAASWAAISSSHGPGNRPFSVPPLMKRLSSRPHSLRGNS